LSEQQHERFAEIEAGLKRLKPAVAERFVTTNAVMQERLDTGQLQQWQALVWQLADAGWHGWETAFDYLELANQIEAPERLLAAGEYCLALVSNSFEPGRSYLRGVARLENADVRVCLESAGELLRQRFQQASNLHSQFFKTAMLIADQENLEGVAAWCDVVGRACELERQAVLDILQRSSLAPVQDWSGLSEVSRLNYQNALDYLQFSHEMQATIGPIEAELLAAVVRYSEQQESIQELLNTLGQVLPLLGDSAARTLVKLLDVLPTVAQAQALVATAEALPLDQEWLVMEWLQHRPEASTELDNEKAIVAYLELASSQSEVQLQSLRGQIRLFEEQRALQLFAEGLCGSRLRIEAGESLPSSDGVTISLPMEISRYETREDNYRFLKTALVHQLGCYEFGTFDLRKSGNLNAFAAHFNHFDQPMLAETIFAICEAARIDWRIASVYAGSAVDLQQEKHFELQRRARVLTGLSARQQLMEALLVCSLDASVATEVDPALANDVRYLEEQLLRLKSPVATVTDAMDIMAICFELISLTPIDLQAPPLVAYRGTIPFDDANLNLQLTALEELQAELTEELADDDDEGIEMHGTTDPADMDVDELEAGDVEDPSAILPSDDDLNGDDFDQVEDPNGFKRAQELLAQRKQVEQTFRYDEWDYGIQDYRRRWCTLFEFRTLEQDFDFVPDTLAEHRVLSNRVRRQLNMLRPELLRKVKGVTDGEELDLERAIEAMVDKKSGVSPSEHIYVQRQRKERDVAALFLLDMSASTDDLIEPEATVYTEQDDEFLHGFSYPEDETPVERGKTILDLEKESVVLMAEALEGLGDSYAVCGFSGYGRDRVEYYVCKDFDEPYNYQAKANIGGIKPCRSTRMGPAIRHATRMLSETESRVKALIIISDGYPQDFDYGQDRNSKDYGIKDTTKALSEASQKGVQSFCLTVDPSGHDYLREMCPDQQYMVMQDITQLPDELSKVYRGLTS
jgi:hypothetical protein